MGQPNVDPNRPDVKIENIVAGVGNVFMNDILIGGIEGDIVLVTVENDLDIDFISQYPGVTLGRRKISKAYFVRFTCDEGTFENIKMACNLANISYYPERKVLRGGSQAPTKYAVQHTFSLWLWSIWMATQIPCL